MATAIRPVYSVYVDTRNGYSVGIHKIRLLKEQLVSNDTYTWDVPRLAPSSGAVGKMLSLENQWPELTAPTNGGGTDRDTVSAAVVVSTINSTWGASAKNSDGSVDLIYATLHLGSVSNSNRTA